MSYSSGGPRWIGPGWVPDGPRLHGKVGPRAVPEPQEHQSPGACPRSQHDRLFGRFGSIGESLEPGSTVAWEGRFGEADLRIEIPPSGRIHAEWRTPAGTRNRVVDSIEQLERSVLFQLMVGAEVTEEMREEVADAVAITLANRKPFPGRDPAQSQNRRQNRRKPRPGQGTRRRGGGGGFRRRGR